MASTADAFTLNNILVVDDTPDNLRLLFSALSGEGYTVRCAKNGPMALTGAQAMPPDLVLLDVRMPQMDGYEVCRRLKQDPRMRDIPVIFLSAIDDGEHKARAFAVGGVDYVAKPFNITEVLARIRHQLMVRQRCLYLERQTAHYHLPISPQQQSSTLMVEILDSLSDGVAALQAVRDDQGTLCQFDKLVTNSALSDFLGQDADALDGAALVAQLSQQAGQDLHPFYRDVVERRCPNSLEVRWQLGGRHRWVEISATCWQDGVVTWVRDIHEGKQTISSLESVQQELHTLATTDSLTQVANRYCFDVYLQAEWQRALRDQQPLALILGDIDKFKRYNDRCGHSQGDRCLHAVAQALSASIERPADLVARYGGEEFVLLLPHTPLAGAQHIAETVHRHIRQLRLPGVSNSECAQVRISLGISWVVPHPDLAPTALIEAADRALYRAKDKGGDCTCVEAMDAESQDTGSTIDGRLQNR